MSEKSNEQRAYEHVESMDVTGVLVHEYLQNNPEVLKWFVATMRKKSAEFRKEWSKKHGEPFPETREDWIRLAAKAGATLESVSRDSKVTPRELLCYIEGGLERLRVLQLSSPQSGSDPARGKKSSKGSTDEVDLQLTRVLKYKIANPGATQKEAAAVVGISVNTLKKKGRWQKIKKMALGSGGHPVSPASHPGNVDGVYEVDWDEEDRQIDEG